ncbi:MAG TPA: ammonium transporter [Clostridia bacterium]
MFSATDTIWVLVATALVFSMQAGFAMVETGFTRAKNAGNIIMKNLMDFALGAIVFWIIGFGLMHGSSLLGGVIGKPDFFILGEYGPGNIPTSVFVIFQTVFAATAATIVSGAMAERTKFIAYCIYSIVITAIIYPISGHWIWGGGWLAKLGFHDFAGSTAVHLVGGVAAFIGAAMLGPRIGKYGKDKKPKAILGHSITLGALGVFILWFGWFGFNPGSQLAASSDGDLLAIGKVFFNTNIAACAGATVAMIITWIQFKKPDISMTLNGALGGLVAITAGCDAVSPLGALIIGIVGGVVVVFAVQFLDKVLKIDDPVGAVAVHGVCGAVGTILVGLFSESEGLFYGHGAKLLGVQTLGVLVVIAWVGVTMTLLFFILKKTVGIRVSAKEELAGLDISEHGLVSAYADFMPSSEIRFDGAHEEMGEVAQPVLMEEAVPVVHKPKSSSASDVKMTKIDIITNESKFETLKEALNKIGITGMTVTNVMGYGMQKGYKTEFYRGVEVGVKLLPKIRLEIVVCKIPVSTVIETAKKALYTGSIGDGKIFVYDVENVIKVRTGEEGFDALQDEE